MKKLISFLLTVVLVLSLSVTAFAKNNEDQGEKKKVATLSICSCMSTLVIAGHTYIYVEKTLEIG